MEIDSVGHCSVSNVAKITYHEAVFVFMRTVADLLRWGFEASKFFGTRVGDDDKCTRLLAHYTRIIKIGKT